MGRKKREEHDSLGKIYVPEEAYYGAETVRASENFLISGLRLHPTMVQATVIIKKAAALANAQLGRLEKDKAKAISMACDEVLLGKFDDQFIVDIFQMGAGTSFHMNCNEVLANRAEEILGGRKGQYRLIHPNDHVNMGQSTNDVFPTAMRLSSLFLLEELIRVLDEMEDAFEKKAQELDNVIKSGRTHLQDAAPIRMGQEFGAYARTIVKARAFLEHATQSLLEVGIGGSAVGTGLNTPPGYAELVVRNLSQLTEKDLCLADDLREAMQSMRPMAEVSAALRNVALEMTRIANDLRLLSSGPCTGLAEISLPKVAPGSSIMPGKVNPFMLEMMNMVCYQVIGCDHAISAAVQAGQLELNVMMPVIAFNLCFMIEILTNAFNQVKVRCIEGIVANTGRCQEYAKKSMGLAAALSPHIGYLRTAEIAQQSLEEGRDLVEIVLEKGLLTQKQADEILNPKNMTEPNL